MKTINRILTFLSLLFLVSCMPDSLTKFDEDVVAEDVSGGTVEVVDNSDGTLSAVSITQVQGDNLILQVDNNNNFNVGDVINVSQTAAVAAGTDSIGSVIAATVQDSNFYLTIALDATTAIPGIYVEEGFFVDNCNSGYGACSATSLGAAQVVLVGFYVTETASFSKTFNPIASNTTMDFTYTVSPSLPNSIQVDTNVAGINTDDAIESPIGPFRIDPDSFSSTPYVFTVSVSNPGTTLDSTETQEVSVMITGSIPGNDGNVGTGANGTRVPTDAGYGRYQFLRLANNESRFYRGSRISINTTDDNRIVTGRVLLKDDSNGILVEATHIIREDTGIDNTTSFYANETVFDDYVFMYVEDITDFDLNDTVSTTSGDSGIIESVDSENSLLHVRVISGSFEVAESITENDLTQTTTVINATSERAIVSGVIEVADATNFNVGSTISTAAGDTAIVMAVDTTSDYLFILHTNGVFSDGEGIDNTGTFVGNETTIVSIVGPIVNITTAGGSDTSTGVDFREGSLVSSSTPGGVQRGAGYAVAGTDISANSLVVQVENFSANSSFDDTNRLDDYTQTNITLGSPYTVSTVGLSNLNIAYVDEPVAIVPHVRGSFSFAQINPVDLPAGLSFSSSTGRVTGTPTETSDLQNYTVTFTYPGETPVSYTFPLVIYSQFEITQVTDNGSSYLLHKEGRGLAGSKCKIFGPQVIDDPSDPEFGNSVQSFNDVYCRLEGGEQDLYKEGIKFNIKSGGGMCEFVNYKPYSYKSVPRETTSATYIRYSPFTDFAQCGGAGFVTTSADAALYVDPAVVNTGVPIAGRNYNATYCEAGGNCIAADTPSSNDDVRGFCRSDHSLLTGGRYNYPNVDEGSYTLVSVTCSVVDSTATTCNCSTTSTVVPCSGNVANSYGGPINDVDSIDASVTNSIIYPAFNSLLEELEIEAPILSSSVGNFRVANYVSENACYGSTPYHIEDSVALGATTLSDSWESFSDINDPFGGADLNQFYGFECLNAAGDLKARIRLQVRDWDRTFTPETVGVEELIPAATMDDSTISCFGSNCNNIDDFDNITGTAFTTCGTPIPMTVDVISVDLVAGSHTIMANGADTFDANNYRRGTRITVGAGGVSGELHFVVEQYIDSQTLIVTTPSAQTASAQAIQYYDGYRFPLEGF